MRRIRIALSVLATYALIVTADGLLQGWPDLLAIIIVFILVTAGIVIAVYGLVKASRPPEP